MASELLEWFESGEIREHVEGWVTLTALLMLFSFAPPTPTPTPPASCVLTPVKLGLGKKRCCRFVTDFSKQ